MGKLLIMKLSELTGNGLTSCHWICQVATPYSGAQDKVFCACCHWL